MQSTPANKVFNIGWLILMLVLAAAVSIYTRKASNARDDSALAWEDTCTVSELLRESGSVELRCPSGDNGAILASSFNDYVALVGNTPISERSEVPATCRYYQSGRWTCNVGDGDEFYRVGDVTPRE